MIRRLLTVASIAWVIAGCAKPTPISSPPPTTSTVEYAKPDVLPATSSDNPVAKPDPSVTATEIAAPEPVKTAAAPTSSAPSISKKQDSPSTEKKETSSVEDLIGQAKRAAAGGSGIRPQGQDFGKAIKLLEQALEQDSKNRMALSLITELTQRHGIILATTGKDTEAIPIFFKSAEYLRKLQQTGDPLSEQEKRLAATVFYNEACGFTRGDQPEKAIASLQEAVDIGFDDLAQLDDDSDMKPLREREDYKKIREQVSKNARKENGK